MILTISELLQCIQTNELMNLKRINLSFVGDVKVMYNTDDEVLSTFCTSIVRFIQSKSESVEKIAIHYENKQESATHLFDSTFCAELLDHSYCNLKELNLMLQNIEWNYKNLIPLTQVINKSDKLEE